GAPAKLSRPAAGSWVSSNFGESGKSGIALVSFAPRARPAVGSRTGSPPGRIIGGASSGELEHEELAGVDSLAADDVLARQRGRITALQLGAIDLRRAAHDLDPRVPAGGDRMLGGLLGVEHAREQPGVGMNRHAAVRAVGRGDQPQPSGLVLRTERL